MRPRALNYRRRSMNYFVKSGKDNEILFHPISRDYGFYPIQESFYASQGLFTPGQHQNSHWWIKPMILRDGVE